LKEKLSVSVLIPTYRRAALLRFTLEGLVNQSYKNFNVVVVLKPSGDKTEEIIERFNKLLRIKTVIQEKGYLTDALNLGLKNAKGDITAFLDDDAIPLSDWLQKLVDTYDLENVGGVAGNVIPAFLNNEGIVQANDNVSELINLDQNPFLNNVGLKTWSCPVKGLENYFVYLSKAGVIAYNFNIGNLAKKRITKSLLGMGANMSILTEATKGFRFPDSWVSGWGNEQFLGWHIRKRGYSLLLNPDAKVHHIVHSQSLSRFVNDSRKLQKEAEIQLIFYRLYGLEKEISAMHRISWVIIRILVILKKAQNLSEAILLLKGVLIGNMLGCKWLISKKLGLGFSPRSELEAIIQKS
jgi:glycosyltransferase involved in cell wall biosynthesis